MNTRRKKAGEPQGRMEEEDVASAEVEFGVNRELSSDVRDNFKLFQENDERRRRDDATREEKFQNLIMSMMKTQLECHQKEKTDLEEAKLQEVMKSRRLEEQRLAELEKQRESEEKRHLELLAFEREKLDTECRHQAEREAARRKEEARRLKERELDRKLREAPPFPRMTETVDMELYMSDFEHHMQDLEIPRERWVTSLRPLLSNWARQTVDLLGEESRRDYQKVRKALLGAYCNEKGSLGHRLIVTKRQKGQNSAQYLTQRQRMWRHWTEDWDKEAAGARLNMEFYFAELPYACRNYDGDGCSCRQVLQ